jgi:hypothetical protein
MSPQGGVERLLVERVPGVEPVPVSERVPDLEEGQPPRAL